MFNQYNLSIDHNWDYLPWKLIYSRIISIQNKIYKLTREYKMSMVYKLQKYLLNCNEAKIISIQNIINKFYLRFKYKKSLKYRISSKYKFLIFKYLYNDKYTNLVGTLIEQIKQYLIYLSIKPEWEAKFVQLTSSRQAFYLKSIINFNKFYTNNYMYFYTSYSNNYYYFGNKIKSKISILKSLKDTVYLRLYYMYFISKYTIYQKILRLYIDNKYNIIYELNLFLFKIFNIEIDWYTKYLNSFFSQTYINLLVFNYSYNTIFNQNLLKKSLINNTNNKKLLNSICNFILIKNNMVYLKQDFNIYNINTYIHITFINYIQSLFKLLNLYIYFLLKKKYKNIFLKYNQIKKSNLNFSKLKYYKKIEHFYINYYK